MVSCFMKRALQKQAKREKNRFPIRPMIFRKSEDLCTLQPPNSVFMCVNCVFVLICVNVDACLYVIYVFVLICVGFIFVLM